MKLGYYRHHEDTEEHFESSTFMRDIILGMADGLTVPFAIAAGLAAGAASGRLIIAGGLAEIAAGSISMGLGGYLAAKSYQDYYKAEYAREIHETEEKPEAERLEVEKILEGYGMQKSQSVHAAAEISRNQHKWVNFMMRLELGLEKPDPKQAVKTASTIAISYIVGGLIPLSPYIAISNTNEAFLVSVMVTIVALVIFGYIRGRFTTGKPMRSAGETLVVGGIAATVAFLIAQFV